MVKNSLWFTLNHEGYCARYHDNGERNTTGYLIKPEERKTFAGTIKAIASDLSIDFYAAGVKLFFDNDRSAGQIPAPKEEREAIEAVVASLENIAKREDALMKKVRLAGESLRKISELEL